MPGSQEKQVGYATKEVINREKFQLQLVGSSIKKEDVAFLGPDPGADVTEAWWKEMLVLWFDVPEEERPAEKQNSQPENPDSSSTVKSKS